MLLGTSNTCSVPIIILYNIRSYLIWLIETPFGGQDGVDPLSCNTPHCESEQRTYMLVIGRGLIMSTLTGLGLACQPDGRPSVSRGLRLQLETASSWNLWLDILIQRGSVRSTLACLSHPCFGLFRQVGDL